MLPKNPSGEDRNLARTHIQLVILVSKVKAIIFNLSKFYSLVKIEGLPHEVFSNVMNGKVISI